MIKPVEVHNLYFKYRIGSDYILKGVDLSLNRGEVLAITGLSGSGKSTLLNIICGIIPHIRKGTIQGEVRLWGKDVKDLKIAQITKKVGIVFQDPDTQLFSPTVEDEIAFGPENLMVERGEIGRRIEKTLKLVQMEEYRCENPNNLSGGQKQLIAIAAVLAMEPELLLFDEITSQVDEEGKGRIKDIISKLKEQGRTIILVDHNRDILELADRLMELKDGKLEVKGW